MSIREAQRLERELSGSAPALRVQEWAGEGKKLIAAHLYGGAALKIIGATPLGVRRIAKVPGIARLCRPTLVHHPART